MFPLLAGALVLAVGLGLVWAASRRPTVKVAVQDVPARGTRAAVRVRVRYDVIDRRPASDPRAVLERLTRAIADERTQELEALVTEAREDFGITIVGFDIEKS